MKPYYVVNWAVGGDDENLGRLDVSSFEVAEACFFAHRDAGDHVTFERITIEGREMLQFWPEDLCEVREKKG